MISSCINRSSSSSVSSIDAGPAFLMLLSHMSGKACFMVVCAAVIVIKISIERYEFVELFFRYLYGSQFPMMIKIVQKLSLGRGGLLLFIEFICSVFRHLFSPLLFPHYIIFILTDIIILKNFLSKNIRGRKKSPASWLFCCSILILKGRALLNMPRYWCFIKYAPPVNLE